MQLNGFLPCRLNKFCVEPNRYKPIGLKERDLNTCPTEGPMLLSTAINLLMNRCSYMQQQSMTRTWL